jgi:hypothetical protein
MPVIPQMEQQPVTTDEQVDEKIRVFHPEWRDTIIIKKGGRFVRVTSRCCGEWMMVSPRTIRLKWERWPEEEFTEIRTESRDAGEGYDRAFLYSKGRFQAGSVLAVLERPCLLHIGRKPMGGMAWREAESIKEALALLKGKICQFSLIFFDRVIDRFDRGSFETILDEIRGSIQFGGLLRFVIDVQQARPHGSDSDEIAAAIKSVLIEKCFSVSQTSYFLSDWDNIAPSWSTPEGFTGLKIREEVLLLEAINSNLI